MAVTIAVNDPNVVYSPYTWQVSGSTFAHAVNMGAYIKVGFTGTSFSVSVDVSLLTGAGVAAGNYPTMSVIIDSPAAPRAQFAQKLLSTDTTISIVTGLADTTHTAYIYIKQIAITGVDRWTTAVAGLRITNFQVDNARGSVPPTVNAQAMLFYGDSIVEGYNTEGSNIADSLHGWSLSVAQAFGMEYGNIGFSSQALCQGPGGSTNVPACFTVANDAASSWNKLWTGVSRLVGGLFIPAPQWIFIEHGRNDFAYSIANATFQAAMVGLLQALRAAAPAAKIVWLVPFSGRFRANVLAGMATYQASPDLLCKVLDLGAQAQAGLDNGSAPNFYSVDAIHPFASTNAQIAAGVALGAHQLFYPGGAYAVPVAPGRNDPAQRLPDPPERAVGL